jgi:hypothetical protein
MASRLLTKYKRWVAKGHFFAGIFLPCYVMFTMVFHGGLKHLDIVFHKARAIATVTEQTPTGTGPGRSRTRYRYEVNGRTYSGGGLPDFDMNRAPITVGSTYEIWYSTAHPSFSTAQEPGILLGQLVVACIILLGVDYLASRSGRSRKASSEGIDSQVTKEGTRS